MSTPTRQITLRRHPMGWVTLKDFEIKETILKVPNSGHVLIRAIYMSLDPYMRGRMDATKTYAQNFQIGEPLKARGLAKSSIPNVPISTPATWSTAWLTGPT